MRVRLCVCLLCLCLFVVWRRVMSWFCVVACCCANRLLHLGVGWRKTNRTNSQLVPSAVSLRITGADQLHQVKRMIRGIGHVLFSTYSQTYYGEDERGETREKMKDKRQDKRRLRDQEKRREDQESYDVLCVWLCGFDFSSFSSLLKIVRHSNNSEFSKLPITNPENEKCPVIFCVVFPNQQTTWAVVEGANETPERENLFDCILADYTEILQIREFIQARFCTKQRWNAQHTLRRRWQTVEGGQLLRRMSHGSKIGPIKVMSVFDTGVRMLGHCCESARHGKPWDVGLDRCLHRRSSKLSSDCDNQHRHLPIHERSWSIVPCSRDLPGNAQSSFPEKTAWLTRQAGKRERDGALWWKD